MKGKANLTASNSWLVEIERKREREPNSSLNPDLSLDSKQFRALDTNNSLTLLSLKLTLVRLRSHLCNALARRQLRQSKPKLAPAR